MNRSFIISAAIGVLSLAAVIASTEVFGNHTISELKASESLKLYIPATPDSIDASKNPFAKENFLKAVSPLNKEKIKTQSANFTTIVPDTAGIFHLTGSTRIENQKDDKGITLYQFQTSLMPEGFFKGKVKIATEGAAKVYLDDKEIISKNSFDSIPTTSSAAISLNPFQNTRLSVNLLSDWTTLAPTLKLEIVPDTDSDNTILHQSPDLKSHFNLNSLGGGERVSTLEISPDGKYLIMTYTNSVDGDKKQTYSDILAVDSGDIILEKTDRDYDWLPNSKSTLYFHEDNADGTYTIYSLQIPSFKRKVIVSGLPSDSKNYTISPDASFGVFTSKVAGDSETGDMQRLTSPNDRRPGNRNRYYLSLIDFQTGLIRPLTYGGPSTDLLDISPDSKKILYSATRETPSKFPFYEETVVELDIRTLKTDTIPGFDSSLASAKYSPDGKKLIVIAGPNAFDGIGLNAGSYEYGNKYDLQGYIYNLNSKEIKPVTRNFNPSIMGDPVWNKADDNIYFRAQAGFDVPVFQLNTKTDRITKLTDNIDYVRLFSISDIGTPKVAYTGLSYDYMGKAYLLNTKTGTSKLLADPMAEYMADINLGHSETWQFTSSDGTLIDGTLTFPPDFNPNKKYPLITYYYGGTTPCTHTNHSPYTPNLFAAFGYLVYTINPSGTIGYGQEFSARHINAWGEKTADEIIEGVQKLISEKSFIDKDKIGCIGASYGGFMTQLLQTKTDLFAAAVSHAGISNITSYWGEGYWGYSYNTVAAANSYPWNNPELFTNHSPLFHADKINTPLLLLHGSADTNVPIGESIQLYNALKILGKEVEFITVDGQNHVILDFQKRKKWHATIMAWFEKWLKNDSRWWNSIYN